MAGIAGTHTAFFYGTLMSPEVLYRVIYGTTTPDPWQKDRLSIRPGLLYGYQRHRVKEADYPAIYPHDEAKKTGPSDSQRVLGTICTGLSDMDVLRLDVFEGDEYDRKKVTAYLLDNNEQSATHVQSSESGTEVETYVWKEEFHSQLDPEEWDFEEFKKEKLKYWAGANVEREDFDDVDAMVAQQAATDGTGGRGANGSITKLLADMQE